MTDFFKQPVFIAMVGIAIVISLAWQYIDNRRQAKETTATQTAQTETPKIVNLSNIDPADFDSIVKDEYALASGKATAVDSTYKLAAIEIELPGDLKPNTGTSRYVFGSAGDKSNNWVITISQTSGNYIRAKIPKEDYLGDIGEMNTKLWKFNYVTALQLAEKNGGLSWRESNELVSIKMVLKHTPPKNWLLWTIEYKGVASSFIKVIDANSGQVVEEE